MSGGQARSGRGRRATSWASSGGPPSLGRALLTAAAAVAHLRHGEPPARALPGAVPTLPATASAWVAVAVGRRSGSTRPGRPGADTPAVPEEANILLCGLEAFAEPGYERASAREPARRLGVSHN
ncbi:hypothetical protein ACWCQQ_03985 [Streptomyces sp. NPDC002143]